MFAIIGILVVLGAVAGGYTMEHGNFKVLMQPAELLIIGGAAAGTLLIANPLAVVMKIVQGLVAVLKGSAYNEGVIPRNTQDAERPVHDGAQERHGETGRGH